MAAYYNENDPFAAEWLRNLITRGLIAAGDVDERSIEDVSPNDLRDYTQCHFFAGIGGWSYALRLAGWPDDRPVWTGSCPCQPFSSAGARKGTDDPRHLWPHWRWLIDQCRPPIIFGEQVASKDGRLWLAGVRSDLEALGYAVGAADLCAAGVGAPHIRQRLYWLADANSERQQRRSEPNGATCESEQQASRRPDVGGRSDAARLDDAARLGYRPPDMEPKSRRRQCATRSASSSCAATLVDTASTGLQGQWSEYYSGGEGRGGFAGLAMQTGVPEWNGPTLALKCSDGARRASAEPGAFPLAYGVPGRVGLLRAYGNAIVPQLAAAFIEVGLR